MFTTIIAFVLILGLLVFVHELGHFVMARRFGVRVDEFGFGLPPRMFGVYKDPESNKWKPAGPTTRAATTIYSLNWIPLGGFVKIKGEQGENPNDTDSFIHKSIGRRVAILSAGVSMNILLAIVILTAGFMIGLPKEIDDTVNLTGAHIQNPTIYITQIIDGFPAQSAGLKIGDMLSSVDGQKFTEVTELQKYVNEKKDQEVITEVIRGKETLTFNVKPQVYPESGEAIMGVQLAKMAIISYPLHIAVWEGLKTTLFLAKEILFAFYNLFKNLLVTRHVAVELSGPVGIAILTGEVARLGFIYILQFTALLSINLAIINFLPLPALDGGRVMFLLLEKIRGKGINARAEAVVHNIGLYLLLLLVLVITFNDVMKFSDRFANLWHAITGWL